MAEQINAQALPIGKYHDKEEHHPLDLCIRDVVCAFCNSDTEYRRNVLKGTTTPEWERDDAYGISMQCPCESFPRMFIRDRELGATILVGLTTE